MTLDSLQKLAAAPVDDATKTVVEEARASARRGEIFTEDEVKKVWTRLIKHGSKARQRPFR